MTRVTIEPQQERERPYVTITLRLPHDLHAQVVAAARAEERSLHAWILRTLRAALAAQPEEER